MRIQTTIRLDLPICLRLPFVSYGGASMFACLVAVGLLQGVHLRNAEH